MKIFPAHSDSVALLEGAAETQRRKRKQSSVEFGFCHVRLQESCEPPSVWSGWSAGSAQSCCPSPVSRYCSRQESSLASSQHAVGKVRNVTGAKGDVFQRTSCLLWKINWTRFFSSSAVSQTVLVPSGLVDDLYQQHLRNVPQSLREILKGTYGCEH